ncbi:MAG: GSCFA domain-containing protein, partial [Saprospiraceae bacterium]|nr:GSCFA domain-containing protein [Saprospiraceae bacterium]
MRLPLLLNTLAMPDFRTALPAAPAPRQINHADPLLLIGSCFSEHIGQKLLERKFDVLTNPFGIVYNPISIAACLSRICAENQAFVEADLFENAGLWHSWQHHGRFSQPDRMQTLQGINTAYFAAAEQLKKTNFLLLTFGTSEVFTLRETGKVVANNHKMPANLFDL